MLNNIPGFYPLDTSSPQPTWAVVDIAKYPTVGQNILDKIQKAPTTKEKHGKLEFTKTLNFCSYKFLFINENARKTLI